MCCEFYYNFPTPKHMEVFFNGYRVNELGEGKQADREIRKLR
jgi:hypothetical protein